MQFYNVVTDACRFCSDYKLGVNFLMEQNLIDDWKIVDDCGVKHWNSDMCQQSVTIDMIL